MDYIEWDGLVSYLENWTGSFKADPSLKDIDEVVMSLGQDDDRCIVHISLD